jgi:two-component system cell cycle sensor histidine kinase/response regulator CckA
MNLAINARDAMPEGGRLIIETRNVELDEPYVREHPGATEGPHIGIGVTDSGVGISQDVQARIFEPFFTTKERGKGTGLGLATVYGIVKQSGGHISVYSEPGMGTSFRIYLPKVNEALPFSAPVTNVSAERGWETILLVEDQTSLRELLEVARSHAGDLHLLMTDVILPGMNGLSLAEQLRRDRPDLKVLFVSGFTENVVSPEGTLGAGSGFLQKPFSHEQLHQKLSDILHERP